MAQNTRQWNEKEEEAAGKQQSPAGSKGYSQSETTYT